MEKLRSCSIIDSSTHDILKRDSVVLPLKPKELLGNGRYIWRSSFGTSRGRAMFTTAVPSPAKTPLEMADLIVRRPSGTLDSSQDAMKKSVTKATADISSISAKVDNGQPRD